MAEIDNIMLEHLRHIRGGLDGLREDVREIKQRLGLIELQYSSLSTRMDRIDGRIERIENRLGLIDA
jgi:septation ring formation regulator EzrA